MAFQPGYKARLLLGDFSLSSKLTDASFPFAVEMLDVTTFADDGVKRFIPGLDTSTVSMSGFLDADTAADSTAWTDAQPLTYGPTGLAAGSPVFMVDTLKTSYEVGTQVSGVVSFDLAAQTDGLTAIGRSIRDLTAATSDGSSSAVDGGAASSGGGVAHLHVTAYSGFTDVNVTVEGSANGTSGWATVATFAQFTGVTSERVTVAGSVARYLRATVDVDGSGSVTFAVGFARL